MLLCLKIIKLVPANNNQIKKENVPPDYLFVFSEED